MLRMIDMLTGHRRVVLGEDTRGLLVRKGRIVDILGAGEHRVMVADVVETLPLGDGRMVTSTATLLERARPDLAEAHLIKVLTGAGEVAVIDRDGRLFAVAGPDAVTWLWRDAGPFAVTRHDLSTPMLETALGERLARTTLRIHISTVEVARDHAGVLSVAGGPAQLLAPGRHHFWKAGPEVTVKVVDLRLRSHDVTGHEILTKDRVTLRVNLTADFRVTDPVRAVTTVHDFEEALHRALALAFRRTLGALTLDALLADKVSVDAEAAAAVRAEMAKLGVEVGAIALKDVILPGEMRDILTRVVAAEKEAEANVIRRREETNATRSLLNTAKVMAENPVMLRLKELEALESIATKVDTLTVHNGTAGLMSDLVKLRD